MPNSNKTPLWPKRGIYAVTPEDRSGAGLARAVAAAVEHGVSAVQYRDKSRDTARRRSDAEALLAVCRPRSVPLIINDDVDLALGAGADGVHLGRDDETLSAARSRLGEDAIIGVSCYDEAHRALAAAEGGADYVAFGSFFPSVTKPGAVRATTALVADGAAAHRRAHRRHRRHHRGQCPPAARMRGRPARGRQCDLRRTRHRGRRTAADGGGFLRWATRR